MQSCQNLWIPCTNTRAKRIAKLLENVQRIQEKQLECLKRAATYRPRSKSSLPRYWPSKSWSGLSRFSSCNHCRNSLPQCKTLCYSREYPDPTNIYFNTSDKSCQWVNSCPSLPKKPSCCCIKKKRSNSCQPTPSFQPITRCPTKTQPCKRFFFTKAPCGFVKSTGDSVKTIKRRRQRRRRETRNMCCRCLICGVAITTIAIFALYWIPIYAGIVGAIGLVL